MAMMKWTFKMRLALDELFNHRDLAPAQRSHAFNSVFEAEIRGFGFAEGVPLNRLGAQYHEKKKMTNKDWVRIASSTLTKGEQEQKQLLGTKIESVLQTLQSSGAARPTSASKRKRQSTDHDDTAMPLRKRRAVATWAPAMLQSHVVTLRLPTKATTSSSKRPAKLLPKKTATSKSPYHMPAGNVIMLRDTAPRPRQMIPPVSQHIAQPPLPKLLFRLWRKDASDRDSHQGFWSRRHHRKNALSSSPPRASSIDHTDVLDHMNRTPENTPFISTSNRLVWMVRKMISELRNYNDYNISVIDVDQLDQRGVYWARPLHDEIRLSKGFTNGAGNYRGTHEFLVWQQIPKAAILHTFKASDFMDLASIRKISPLLRLDVLRGRENGATKLAILRQQSVRLSRSTVDAMATLVDFFGIQSDPGHISAIVTGLCEGWGLFIQQRSEREWQELANHFADELHSFRFQERLTVKYAFLDGVAWGCGDINARHTVAATAVKVRKATAVGLASPSDILMHELDSMKLALKLHEKAETRLLQRYHAIEPTGHAGGTADNSDGYYSGQEERHIHVPANNDDDGEDADEGTDVASDGEQIRFELDDDYDELAIG